MMSLGWRGGPLLPRRYATWQKLRFGVLFRTAKGGLCLSRKQGRGESNIRADSTQYLTALTQKERLQPKVQPRVSALLATRDDFATGAAKLTSAGGATYDAGNTL